MTKWGNGSHFFMLIGAIGSRWRRSHRRTCRRDGCSLVTVLTRRGSLRNFYRFGFVLWESDRAEGGRRNEKIEKMGMNKIKQVTKQLWSDRVTGMRPTNS